MKDQYMNHLVEFDKLNWISPAKGVRYKSFVSGNERLRLAGFSEGFVEPDWCPAGHAGYVLEGAFSIDFGGKTERFEKGDALFIPRGESDKHKVIMNKGERVLLLLFEVL
jgi:quercetin dioxygenase-like cupin family protein